MSCYQHEAMRAANRNRWDVLVPAIPLAAPGGFSGGTDGGSSST